MRINNFEKSQGDNTIEMAVSNPWRSLHPGQQHTLMADIVLKHQFEPLIEFDHTGIPAPLAAKSWSVNDSRTEYTFFIDKAKTFTDGSHLTALDFKNSWETSLSIEKYSENSSLQDVLYKIKGFSDFKNKKTIQGIEVVSDEILKLHFVSPFRMALEELSGVRYAAYKMINENTYIGTGNYIIKEISNRELMFIPRPDSKQQKPSIHLNGINTPEVYKELLAGRIDVMPYFDGSVLPTEILHNHKITSVIGFEALHYGFEINKMPGRIFESKENRRALLSIIYNSFESKDFVLQPDFFNLSAQLYLPIQHGYISDTEVSRIIKEGEKYIPNLIEQSKKQPLTLILPVNFNFQIEAIKKTGLHISDKSRYVKAEEFFNIMYKTYDADLLGSVFSLSHGDSDGIYHKLGKNGAIASMMSISERVSNLLEEGRKIVNIDNLDDHYKKVNQEFLKEVPMIHIGFARSVALYRNDRIKVNTEIKRRNDGQFQIFEVN